MTATSSGFPRFVLGEPGLRSSLAQLARRRVPASEVEDIAQTALCDALAAAGLPDEPDEIRRFVTTIARNRVVDYHRRERRIAREVELGEMEPVAEGADLDSRALLERVATSVAASSRDRETLGWLLREHAGEQLAEIAADVGLPPPTVRQRVSRLRRALRARWAHALALLLLVGSSGALARHASEGEAAAIVADPIGDPAARALGLVQGRWRIDRAIADDAMKAPEKALFEAARVVDVRIDGAQVTLSSPAGTTTRTLSLTPREDGAFDVVLAGGSHGPERGIARLDGARVAIALRDGALRGTATLAR